MLVKSYTEENYQRIPPVRLSDEEYARALQCFVPACVDIVPINSPGRLIYLAKRETKPMLGWWWTGGRIMPNETKEEAAIRSFKREADVLLTAERLNLVAVLDYRFKDRAQMPDNIGCHMLGITFTVEVTPDELAHISSHLEQKEFTQAYGLIAFTRADLVSKQVTAPVLDMYDHLFPSVKQVCC